MSIKLIQWNDTLVTPKDDRILYDNGFNGIIDGCELTTVGLNVLHINSGYIRILGGLIEVKEQEIEAETSSQGVQNGQLWVNLDLSAEDPVCFITEASTHLTTMSQNMRANYVNGIYQMQLATYNISETTISNFVVTAPTIRTIKNEIIHEIDAVFEKLEGTQGRNLIPFPYYSGDLAVNGVTFSTNADGSVTINGTPSSNVYFYFTQNLEMLTGTYTYKVVSVGGTISQEDSLWCRIWNAAQTKDFGFSVNDYFTKEFTEGNDYRVTIRANKNVTYTNYTIKPMLEIGTIAHVYEPTTESNIGILNRIEGTQGRNLVPYPYYRADSYTHNGITFTVNANDGSVTANGTASGNAYMLLCGRTLSSGLMLKSNKTYTLGKAPSGASSTTYYIYVNYNTSQGGATSKYAIAYEEPLTFSPTDLIEAESVGLIVYIKSGQTVSNLTFYPMLEEGTIAHSYEPTKQSNVTLSASNNTGDVIISSGNYKDTSYIFYRKGYVKVFKATLRIASGTTNSWVELGTIPSEFMPVDDFYNCFTFDNNINVKIHIATTGKIRARLFANYSGAAVSGADLSICYI